MLRDDVRNEAYRAAINHVVKPGDTVIDMGAGSGILSLFAAQAGASRVYAVERTDIAAVARKIIERNGFADTITVIQSNLEDIVLPGRVDVIMSEWMGGFGVDENMLAPLVIARDRWLKPKGTIIPHTVTAMLAPMWVVELDSGLQHWRSKPHGVDLSVIADLSVDETVMAQWPVTEEDLIAPPQAMWSHDAYTCSLEVADRPFVASLVFTAARSGGLSALAAWFDARLCEGVSLTNAVGAPDTHWGRFMFPLDRTIEVREGATIKVELRCEPTAPGGSEMYWSTQVDDGPIERHDTRQRRVAMTGG
jgi:protein arginine N-methyltransferase 1